MMNNSIINRLISMICYLTAGFFGIIYFIFMYMVKKPMSSYVVFNIYQSIFISIFLYILSFVYRIFLDLIGIVPFVGKYVLTLDSIIFKIPIAYGYTIAGLLVLMFSLYFVINCLLGIKPYVPFVSQIVHDNFRC